MILFVVANGVFILTSRSNHKSALGYIFLYIRSMGADRHPCGALVPKENHSKYTQDDDDRKEDFLGS